MVGSKQSTRRRWLSFQLRTFLLAITGIAIWLGWWVNSAHQQQRAVAAIRQALVDAGRDANEVGIFYDYQIEKLKTPNFSEIPFPDAGIRIAYDAAPWEPGWMLDALGVDFFHNIVGLHLSGGNGANSVLENVGGLRNLQHLDLLSGIDDDAIDDAGVACLRRLQRLKSLSLGDCAELSDDSLQTIGTLRQLEVLSLWWGNFTDRGLSHLKNLHSLRILLIEEPQTDFEGQITDVGVSSLADLVNVETLYLNADRLTGLSLKHLARMQKLASLSLVSPHFVDEDLRFLARLSSLGEIDFVGTKINGTGFKYLIGHQKLTALSLRGTLVNDNGLAEIARLPNLEWANFRETAITAAGLEQLRACPKLQTVYISPDVPGDITNLREVLAPCVVEVSH